MTIREKILIVEDEKSIAHFISTILTTNGYETILAKTGTEAMTMLSSHCPDLVILDLGLPDMDGIEVLRSAARSPPMLFGRTRQAVTWASPISFKPRRTGTATCFMCMPMKVSPISIPTSA